MIKNNLKWLSDRFDYNWEEGGFRKLSFIFFFFFDLFLFCWLGGGSFLFFLLFSFWTLNESYLGVDYLFTIFRLKNNEFIIFVFIITKYDIYN